MLSSATQGIMPMSFSLIEDFENKRYQSFSILKNDLNLVVNSTIEKLKYEQLIAGMAFRFFRLHNMPIYKANVDFLGHRYVEQLPVTALFLLGELEKCNHLANDGMIDSNNISKYKSDLTNDAPDSDIISYSITVEDQKVLLAYNTSKWEAYEKYILISKDSYSGTNFLKTIFGYDTSSFIQVFDVWLNESKIYYIKLYLNPMQLVVLKNF